jgi:YegS/Rv2252/BmrU family lipid kinase
MNQKPKLLFVINLAAGNSAIDWKQEIETYFKDKEVTLDFFVLPKKIVKKELKIYLLNSNADKVIAVGGDGTITLVANILLHSKIPLGILPAGSANGMAKEFGISLLPQEAIAVIETGKIISCDSITINDQMECIHLSDIGLNAQLIKYFDEGKLRGKIGYAKVILKTLWRTEKIIVNMETADEKICREAFMVVLANASKYGTGAVINPGGSVSDGFFELVIVKRINFLTTLKMLVNPGPYNTKHIEIFKCRSVSINTKRKVPFQIDGEYMGKVKNIKAAISAGSLEMILPQTNS